MSTAMSSTATSLPYRAVLEVERKFRSDISSFHRFRTNRGEPPFQSLSYLGRRHFEDTYYDRHKFLSSRGVWVRRRDQRWEAKVRRGGDFTNSQFEELGTTDDISRLLESLGLRPSHASQNFGLQTIARFSTVRDAWQADTKFEVVLDKTDFNHVVGEVELQRLMESNDAGGISVEERQAALAEMNRQIEGFMQRYSWAFPSGKPVGKLSAYFDRRARCTS